MTWRQKAAPIIAGVLTEHKDSDEKTLRKALRDAYPFGERKYFPYKVWLDEIKRQRGTKKPKPKKKLKQSKNDKQLDLL